MSDTSVVTLKLCCWVKNPTGSFWLSWLGVALPCWNAVHLAALGVGQFRWMDGGQIGQGLCCIPLGRAVPLQPTFSHMPDASTTRLRHTYRSRTEPIRLSSPERCLRRLTSARSSGPGFRRRKEHAHQARPYFQTAPQCAIWLFWDRSAHFWAQLSTLRRSAARMGTPDAHRRHAPREEPVGRRVLGGACGDALTSALE